MNQRKYIIVLLQETSMLGCQTTKTPIEPNLMLQTRNPNDVKGKDIYQRLKVDLSIYLIHAQI